MSNDKNNSENFSEKAGISVERANIDFKNTYTQKWYTPRGSWAGFIFYPIHVIFYFLKLDRIKWQIRIPSWVGISKEDIFVPGMLLLLYALTLCLLYWLV